MLILLTCVGAGLLGSCSGRRYDTRLSNTPPALLQLDQGAQAVIAAAPEARWPQVYRYVQTMENAWKDYKRPTVVAWDESRQLWERNLRGEVDAAMARLREAALARDATATANAARDVDTAVLNLFEFYETAVTQAISAPPTE
ncbi:MAG: hypothetical protein A2Y76_13330 [Planctomycetes bacterium RBG_13_60_9]|nr:MAG: hypothetical protein A2Y76_13330 [Planctomycetes bacterium RBG_13_60_9]